MISRAERNNNPLNLRKSIDRWQGAKSEQRDSDFVEFESMFYGFRAGLITLRTYAKKYGLDTIEGAIRRFAPPVENNTEGYIQRVCAGARLQPSDKIWVSQNRLYAIAKDMATVESGYWKEEWSGELREAVALVGDQLPA